MIAERFLEERLATIVEERDEKELLLVRQYQCGLIDQLEFCMKIRVIGQWADRQCAATKSDLERTQAEFTAAKGEAT